MINLYVPFDLDGAIRIYIVLRTFFAQMLIRKKLLTQTLQEAGRFRENSTTDYTHFCFFKLLKKIFISFLISYFLYLDNGNRIDITKFVIDSVLELFDLFF